MEKAECIAGLQAFDGLRHAKTVLDCLLSGEKIGLYDAQIIQSWAEEQDNRLRELISESMPYVKKAED